VANPVRFGNADVVVHRAYNDEGLELGDVVDLVGPGASAHFETLQQLLLRARQIGEAEALAGFPVILRPEVVFADPAIHLVQVCDQAERLPVLEVGGFPQVNAPVPVPAGLGVALVRYGACHVVHAVRRGADLCVPKEGIEQRPDGFRDLRRWVVDVYLPVG